VVSHCSSSRNTSCHRVFPSVAPARRRAIPGHASTFSLGQPDTWPCDVDKMAEMYDRGLNLLDQVIPCRHVVRPPRPSDPWFDAECRAAKRQTRRLERAYASARRHNLVLGHFFLCACENRHYLCFRSEIRYHDRFQRLQLPIMGWKFLRFDNV